MAGNDFTLKLGADNTALVQGLQQSMQSLASFTGAAKGALAGLAGGLGLKALTKDFMDYHTNLSNATQVMGYSVREVEAIGGAMRRFGGDTSGAIASLDSLTNALQQATWGSGPLLDVTQRFGVNFMKSNGELMNAEELLGSLSNQLNTFDARTKQAIASQLGLDAALLRVIDSGNFSSMVASQRALGLSTEQDLKLASEMESAWLDLKDSFTLVARELSRVLVPYLTKLMRSLHSLIQSTRSLRGQLTGGLSAILSAALPLAAPLAAVSTALAGWGGAVKTVTNLHAALKGLLPVVKGIASPFKLVGLAIGALILIAEDLYVYSQGTGKSLFGTLLETFPALETALQGTATLLGSVFESIKSVFTYVTSFTWDGFVNGFMNALIAIENGFYSMLNFIIEKVNTIISTVKRIPGLGGLSELSTIQYREYRGVESPAGAQGMGQVTTSNKTENHINITQNIQNADPQAVASRTEDAVLQAQAKILNNRPAL